MAQIQDHSCTKSTVTPTAIENDGADNFGNQVMNHRSGKEPSQQIEKEFLNLHILLSKQAKRKISIYCLLGVVQTVAPEPMPTLKNNINSNAYANSCAKITKFEKFPR